MRRTTVRLYVVVVHQMWNFPTIMHYEFKYILVLMEDGLRDPVRVPSEHEGHVLILVLMEDGLREMTEKLSLFCHSQS